MGAVEAAVDGAVRASALSAVEGAAKLEYEACLARGVSHERGWDLYMTTLLAAAGLDPSRMEGALEAVRVAHAEFNLWRRVPEGLPEALRRARAAGLRLAVISNSEGKLPALFARVGLGDLFEHVVDSALEGVRKPDPQLFERALARSKVSAAESLYAGDLPTVDVEAAQAVGMRAALIDPLGFYPEYEGAPRYDGVVELIEALLAAGSG